MTAIARGQAPPPDDWKRAPGGHPLCQVCEKPLTPKWLRDPQLGPCCIDCAPFVVSADKLLRGIRITR